MKPARPIQELFLDSFESEKKLRHFSEEINQQIKNHLAVLFVFFEKNHRSKEEIKSLNELLWLSRSLGYSSSGIRKNFKLTDVSSLFLEQMENTEAEFQDKQVKPSIEVESELSSFSDPVAISHAFQALLKGIYSSSISGGSLGLKLEQKGQGITILANWKTGGDVSPFSSLCFQLAIHIFEAHGGQLINSQISRLESVWELLLPCELHPTHKSPLYLEKRRFPRVCLDLEARVGLFSETRNSFETGGRGRIEVISEGGALLIIAERALSKPKRGQDLTLQILIPAQSGFVVKKARVVDIQRDSEEFRLGLEFIECDGEAKKMLAALVKTHAS